MRRTTTFSALAALLLVMGGGLLVWNAYAQADEDAGEQSPETLLEQGDSLFDERSYRQAAEAYTAYLEQVGEVNATTNRVRRNLSIAYVHTNKYDEAIEALEQLAQLNEDGRWEVLARRQLMLIRLDMPTYYWKKDGERYWQRWVQQARRVWIGPDNQRDALAQIKRAHELQEARVEALGESEVVRMAELGLLAQLKREFADLREGADAQWEQRRIEVVLERPGGERQTERISVPSWPNREQIKQLYVEAAEIYDELARLGASEETRLRGGLALYAKALFVDRIESSWQSLQDRYGEILLEGDLPEPPNAMPYYEAVRERYPESRRAAEAWMSIAHKRHNAGDRVAAVEELRKLQETYPEVKWASDAAGIEQMITAPRMRVNLSTSLEPGGDWKITTRSRNVERVQFRAYEFDLVGLMRDERFQTDPNATFNDTSSLVNRGHVERFRGASLGEWSSVVKDDGTYTWIDHEPVEVEIDRDYRGAFVLISEAGGITQSSLHVVTDLAIVMQPSTQRTVHWLVERETGEPVGPAEVYMRQRYSQWRRPGTTYHVVHTDYVADDAGLVELPRYTRPDISNPRYNATATLAVTEDGRFAVTNQQRQSSRAWDWGRQYRHMLYTERPVYRPGHTVYLRGIVREFAEREYRTATEQTLQYSVIDPRRERIASGTVELSEFGSYDFSVDVPQDATLGRYRVVMQGSGRGMRTSQSFAVEEYIVPEYEVLVEGADGPVRQGDDAAATIRVEYYAGGPVAEADVSYRVYREVVWSGYTFPRRGAWFHRGWYYQPSPPRRGRPLIAEGEEKADENGEVQVEFSTEAPKLNSNWWSYRFVIEAEAADESRRVIEGRGAVTVAEQAFNAYLHTEREVYREGDRVELQLRTQTPDGDPVSVEGQLRLARLAEYWTTETDEDGHSQRVKKRDEDFFATREVQSDADGELRFSYVFEEPERYTVKFVSEDPWGNEIVAQTDLIVVGEDGNLAEARFSQLELVPATQVTAVGETARITLTTTEPGTTALLVVDTGQHAPDHRLVHIPGTAREIELPVAGIHAPNFWVSAYTVRKGRLQQTRTEMFVLPEPKFLEIEIDTHKPEYRPGEDATFSIAVRDAEGDPVEAELSLGVVDEALYYIAPDRTPDPRSFFYERRRRFSTSVRHSLSFRSSVHRESANEYTVYESHGRPSATGRRGYGYWTSREFELRKRQRGTASEYGLDLVGTEHISVDALDVEEFGRSSWPDSNNAFRWFKSDSPQPGYGERRRARGGAAGDPEMGRAMRDSAPAEANELREEAGRAAWDAEGEGAAKEESEELADPQVRADFRDLAFWDPAVRTDTEGKASVDFTFPDNLTRWNVRALTVDRNDRFGLHSVSVNTTKNIEVRMRAPRFFVERDEVVLTAVVRNQFEEAKDVTMRLDIPGELELLPGYEEELVRSVPAESRTSVDWRVRVVAPGMPTIRMSALTDEESDAHELTFPARVYGAPISVVRAGVIRRESESGEATVELEIPKQLDETQTQLRLSLQPSIISTALDAIPYLIQFPYGCMEQTMSRFMPAVAVRRTLTELGMSLEQIATMREEADLSDVPVRHRGLFRNHPVFDEEKLNAVIRAGMQRIVEGQAHDGGWGWWPGTRRSNPYMTAYVLHALWVARQGGVTVDEGMMRRAHDWLANQLKGEGRHSLHHRTYMAYALAKTRTVNPEVEKELHEVVREELYERRDELTNYTRALLAITVHKLGMSEKSEVLARNMMSYIEVHEENQTARFRDYRGRGWWFWHRDRIEATSWSIRALLRIAPDNEKVPMLMKWLINNRRGNAWHSTKATAFAILSVNEYAQRTGELNPDYTVEVYVNGEPKRSVRVTTENMFALPEADLYFTGEELAPGKHEIKLVRQGRGTCYFTAHLEYFSKEDHIEAEGGEINVQRTYYRLNEKRRTDEEGNVYQEWEREKIEEGDEVKSGDLIEVELEIECLNDYEYLCFEDPKPAGMESVEMRSGYRNLNGVWGYIEFRDEQIVTFVSWANQGTIRYSYQLRAEIPGRFHALPVQAYGMYSPDLRANSDSAIITIRDRDE